MRIARLAPARFRQSQSVQQSMPVQPIAKRVIAGTAFLLFVLGALNPAFLRAQTTPESKTTPKAEASLEGTQPAQWRLIWKDKPATQATISWTTAKHGRQHRVHLSEGDDGKAKIVKCQRNGQFTKDDGEPELYFHHTRLTGLKPSTKYRVVLESDKNRSQEMYFITAPTDRRSFQLLFGGDSRSGRKQRKQMNRMMGSMLNEQPSILALVHGGDYVANGDNLNQFSAWMSDHELTTTKGGRLLPILPARGNHDISGLYNEVFDFPDGDLNYYATTVSPLMRMVTLNTNISLAGDQADWLDAELAHSRPKYRWLLTQYHRPAYPAVKAPGGAKISWVPLFEKYNVDMVCEADGHAIKRTVPIRNDRVDPTGVVYIGEGGLGVGQRKPKADRWYLQSPGMSGQGHHLQLLSFDEEKLVYRVILLGGKVFDKYVMHARGKKSNVRRARAKVLGTAAGN